MHSTLKQNLCNVTYQKLRNYKIEGYKGGFSILNYQVSTLPKEQPCLGTGFWTLVLL